MSYFTPTFCNIFNNRSLRFWKQRYASKLSYWYLILRHNISIKFSSGEYGGKKKIYTSCSLHPCILAWNFLRPVYRWIIKYHNCFLIVCSTNWSIKQLNLSVLNVDSSISKNSLFLRFIKPTTFRNLPLTAGSNIGFSFVYQA
jgi:hypothetical protein